LKPAEVTGPLSVQAAGVRELLVDRLHDLPHASQPAPQRLGPRGLTMPLGRTDDLGLGGLPPRALVRPPLKALIAPRGAKGRAPHTQQPRVRLTTQGKAGGRQWLLLGTGWTKAKASNHSHWVDGQQQLAPFLPAQAVAPADSGQPRQPAGPAPLAIPRRDPGAVQGSIGPALSRQERYTYCMSPRNCFGGKQLQV
jgi:hypothetical protein